MLADKNGFVKLPISVLLMDMPAEAKILYCILEDRISYSNFKDGEAHYYFLSSKERQELQKIIGCKRDTFYKHMKLLKEKCLISTEQHGFGVRIFNTPRCIKKSNTDNWCIKKSNTDCIKKSDTEVPEKILHPLNQNNKPDLLKQNDSIICNTVCPSKPEFKDVLLYWRQKHYHSSPADYFTYYDLRKWMINDQPVRDWRRLADKWEERQF